MYEYQEAEALKRAVDSIDFAIDKNHCEMMAKTINKPLDKDLVKVIFADNLRQSIMIGDSKGPDRICPPANEDWKTILADKPELSAKVNESIKAAFRFGVYYAMQESGAWWVPAEQLTPRQDDVVVSRWCDEPMNRAEYNTMKQRKYKTEEEPYVINDDKEKFIRKAVKMLSQWKTGLYSDYSMEVCGNMSVQELKSMNEAEKRKVIDAGVIALLKKKDKRLYNRLITHTALGDENVPF